MDENFALEEKAAARDSVSIEVLRSMRSEVQRELEGVIAQAQYTTNGVDSWSEMMEEDLQENMSHPGDPEVDSEADNDRLPIPMWQTLLPSEGDTATGTSSDAKSKACGYKRSDKLWIAFQATLNTATSLSRLNLTSKDLYLPGRSDDYVNCGLA
jgi:hypothetical protein